MKLDPERYECPEHQVDITDQVIRTYNGMHVKVGTLGGGTGAVASAGSAGGDEESDGEQRAGASAPSEFGSNAAKHSSISK
jgi:hypothetical protein